MVVKRMVVLEQLLWHVLWHRNRLRASAGRRRQADERVVPPNLKRSADVCMRQRATRRLRAPHHVASHTSNDPCATLTPTTVHHCTWSRRTITQTSHNPT
jgi:hypothetical protein